ncbi:hypothetical protein ACQUFY_08380 [Robbsia andropogonis]|uniref:hypothetical protein n=1 Tax=Robbsia andropogonis TaxID=28092 RepID=UPI003D20C4E6
MSTRKDKHRRVAAAFAVDMTLPVAPAQRIDLGIAYYQSYALLVEGRGTFDHWEALVGCVNVARVLAAQVFDDQLEHEITAGQLALVRMKDRHAQCGRWKFDDDGAAALWLALQLHDGQLMLVTRGEMRAAVIECMRLRRAGSTYKEAA